MRRTAPVLAVLGLLVGVAPVATASADSADPAAGGTLSGVITQGARPECFTAQYQPTDGYRCPPAAMATAVLSSGHVLFWDGLEGMNRIQVNTVAEFGDVAQDDQSRVATFGDGTAEFQTPDNQTGAPTDGHSDPVNPLIPGGAGANDNSADNNYDLFCSSLVQLPNGDVLAAGGTHYYTEPGVTDPVTGKTWGVSELQGLKATRIFDPTDGPNGAWRNAKGDMHFGRWYPTVVTLGDGHIFVASGVTKLIKPVYTDGRAPTDSGRNVVQTETFDPSTESWTQNPDSASQSLPLFPRLHLLPDGKVYYDAAGQTFNPDGQAYDEATWVNAKVYDPAAQTWTDLQADTPTGLPLVANAPVGFRGSGFSVMLPLAPPYTQAKVFNGGGVVGPTPGDYLGDDSTTINTIDTTGGKDTLHSEAGPQLLNRRWYGSAVVLPDGEVFVTNGANRDEVDAPGSGNPVMQTELVDPTAGTVTAGPSLADGHDRTYHNSAVLLPDGRVLIGGHAPIATGYGIQSDAGTAAGLSKPEADSTFQIYSPPYLHYGVAQPQILGIRSDGHYGQQLEITTPQADEIAKVVLVRDPSVTHLTDADQRVVEVPIDAVTNGDTLHLTIPDQPNALPPGPYMLFIERAVTVGGQQKLVPSVSQEVLVSPADSSSGSTVTTGSPARPTTAAAFAAARPATVSAPAAARGSRVVHFRPTAAADRRSRSPWSWSAMAAVGLLGLAVLGRRRRPVRSGSTA